VTQRYDVVIVGGGIHGVGVAQAAAAGGHTTLLIEQGVLAGGTSSRSSKLIHGGLRYLESGRIGLYASRCVNARCCCGSRRNWFNCGRSSFRCTERRGDDPGRCARG